MIDGSLGFAHMLIMTFWPYSGRCRSRVISRKGRIRGLGSGVLKGGGFGVFDEPGIAAAMAGMNIAGVSLMRSRASVNNQPISVSNSPARYLSSRNSCTHKYPDLPGAEYSSWSAQQLETFHLMYLIGYNLSIIRKIYTLMGINITVDAENVPVWVYFLKIMLYLYPKGY